MEKSEQNSLISKVGDLGKISQSEAWTLLDELADDGIASRSEAEAVFKLNRQISEPPPEWSERFCGMLKDFLLTAEAPIGWMDKQECNWLISQIAPYQAAVTMQEIDLLLDVLPHAEGAPRIVSRSALNAIVCIAARNGRMSSELLERLLEVLLNGPSDSRTWITQWEAKCLLEINDKVRFSRNVDEWNSLFARAIANHLMARAHPAPETMAEALDRKQWFNSQTDAELGGMYLLGIQSTDEGRWFERFARSPAQAQLAHTTAQKIASQAGTSVEAEEDWLVRRLGWDKTMTPAEHALIGLLKDEAPGFVNGLTIAKASRHPTSEMAFS